MSLVLGDGHVFKFWLDPWLGESGSSKSQFLRLFRLSSQKNACVREFYSVFG